jgi:hypothetical protein
MNIVIGIFVILSILFFASDIVAIFNDFKGKPIYDDLAKELGAVKIEANLFRIKVNGATYACGQDFASTRPRQYTFYFFIAGSFYKSGYLGIYGHNKSEMASLYHPDAEWMTSGDPEFDQLFFIHGKGSDYAASWLASPKKREIIRRLWEVGFSEILFNDNQRYLNASNIKVRIKLKSEDNLNGINSRMILEAANLLRELGSI